MNRYLLCIQVFQNHTNQATYDKFGNLHTTYPKAGTVDFWESATVPHFMEDVEPLHWAVYLDHRIQMHLLWGPKAPTDILPNGYMEKYYRKRPLY